MIVVPTRRVFANRADAPAAPSNVFIPGGFDENMPAIVKGFEEND